MTRKRRSNGMNRKRPPDRDGAARPVTATRVLDHAQNSQTLPAMTARSPDCLGPSHQSADPNALMVHWQRQRRHSTPIAPAARGAA